jgi:TolB protein
MVRRRIAVPVVLALALAALIAVTPSDATFAGRNGRIVFSHFTSSSPPQITTLTPNGRHARVLTDYRRDAVAADVSPRGGRIAFTVLGTPKIPDKLLTMRRGGADVRKLTHGCSGQCLGDGEAAWSPDGRQIVFNRAYGPIVDDTADHVDLMIMNRNGTHMRVLLHSPDYGKRRLEAGRWTWSPDGTQLAGTFQDVSDPSFPSAIYTVELDSLDIHRITPWHMGAGNPDYSPDGRRIVFNSGFEGQVHSSLYTIGPDGTNMRRLNHPGTHYTFGPRFSPSGNQIVYMVAGRNTTFHLARRTIGGEVRKRITRSTMRGLDPVWAARP